MVFLETLKHRFETKNEEAIRLLKRVAELSHVNSQLHENVGQVTKQNIQLSSQNSELLDKVRSLKAKTTVRHVRDLSAQGPVDTGIQHPTVEIEM